MKILEFLRKVRRATTVDELDALLTLANQRLSDWDRPAARNHLTKRLDEIIAGK